MPTINIRRKCPLGSKKGKCQDDGVIQATNGKLPDPVADYGYVTHDMSKITWTGELTYDGISLQIKHGNGKSTSFSQEYPNLQEVTTYYYTKGTYNKDDIKVPLVLRIHSIGRPYYLYLNKGGDHTKWEQVPLSDDFTIHTDHATNLELTDRLNSQACKLHNLDSVDINAKSSYRCPCGKTNVTVSEEKSNGVDGYTKYKHEYTTNPNSVTYDGTVLRWKDEGFEGEIPLSSEHIRKLYVYYWEKDANHRKPLMIEVAVGIFGNGLIPLGNDGEKDNSEWSMMKSEDGSDYMLTPSQTELKDKLQDIKCKLFSPVVIDVSVNTKAPYINKYCKDRNCKKGECPKKIEVIKYTDSVPLGYTAWKHTYGGNNKTFTVTSFKGSPSETNSTIQFPIWDVKEVVVFLTECNVPLLVYVKQTGGGTQETHKWYSRTNGDGGDKWKEEGGRLGSNPPDKAMNGNLESVLKDIKTKLNIECPEDKEERERKEKEERIRKEEKARAEAEAQIQLSQSASLSGNSAKDGELCKAIGTLINLGSITAAEVGLSATEELIEWNNELGLDASTLALNLVGEALGLANIVLASGDKEESEDTEQISNSVPELQVSQDAKTTVITGKSQLQTGGNNISGTSHKQSNTVSLGPVTEPNQGEGTQSGSSAEGTPGRVSQTASIVGAGFLAVPPDQVPQDIAVAQQQTQAALNGHEGQAEAQALESSDLSHRTHDPVSSQVPLPRKPSGSGSNNIIETTISVTTGFLTTSALACFAGFSHVMLPAASLKSGKRVEQLLTILDLRGFQMSQINTKLKAFLSAMTLVTQNYYPELLGKLLFVNTPGMFSALWAIFSGLLDKKTLGKITVISSKTESRAKILELVEPDQLPEFLGGTQPDDTWQTSHFGPWGDEEIIKSLRDTNPHLPLELFELKCL